MLRVNKIKHDELTVRDIYLSIYSQTLKIKVSKMFLTSKTASASMNKKCVCHYLQMIHQIEGQTDSCGFTITYNFMLTLYVGTAQLLQN